MGKRGIGIAATLILAATLSCSVALAAETIPFVGCASQSQAGREEAPPSRTVLVSLAPELALQVAYYGVDTVDGVLAPRGWRCFKTGGSATSELMVYPPDSGNSESPDPKGDAVILRVLFGDTSGRGLVERYLRGVFPGRISESTDAEQIGPFPADQTTQVRDNLVEFNTPANQKGLGTSAGLSVTDRPVVGAVRYDARPDGNLILLQIRLPEGLQSLSPAILGEFEGRTCPYGWCN